MNGCLCINFRYRLGNGGNAMLAGHVVDFKCDHGFFRQKGLKKIKFLPCLYGKVNKKRPCPFRRNVHKKKIDLPIV